VSTAPPPDTSARGVGRDLLLYIPGRAIPAVVQILTVTALTAFFTVEEIGRYELTFRFVLFLTPCTTLWLNMAMLRYYAASQAEGEEAAFYGGFGFLKYLNIAAGDGLGLLAWAFGPDWLVGGYRGLTLVGLAVYVAYRFSETGLIVLRARRMPGIYSIATSLNAGVRLPLAILLFAVFGFGVDGMLWALAACYGAVYLVLVSRWVGPPRWPSRPEDRTLLRDVAAYGAPVWVIQILNYLINTSDRYLLNGLAGEAEVGYYMVAANLVDQPMWLVFQTFTLAVFPTVAAAWEQRGRADAERLVGEVTRIFIVLCVPLCVLLAVLARPLFGALAQGEAVAAQVAAPWVAAGAFFYGLSYFANMGLHLAKRTAWLLGMTALALGVNVLGNVVLIPDYGFVGAGMARSVSNFALVLLVAAASHRFLTWRFPWRSLLRCAGAAALVGVPLWFAAQALPPNLPSLAALGTLGLAGYGLLLLVLREVPRALLRDSVQQARQGWRARGR